MINLIIQLPVLLFSVIIHEFAHGWIAYRCGDDTAKSMGRLTINPIPHIDVFGTILLPAFCMFLNAPIFGWAKPVPINPYRFNNPDRDVVLVSIAGPMSNFLLAASSSLIMWLMRSYISAPVSVYIAAYELLKIVMIINVVLFVFNLIPIPPLDGSKVLSGILPSRLAYKYSQLEPYGFYIIIILMATNFFSIVLGPVINFVIYYLAGGANYL